MSIYSDKLAHVQVVINCQYSIAQMYVLDDIMSQSELTTRLYKKMKSIT